MNPVWDLRIEYYMQHKLHDLLQIGRYGFCLLNRICFNYYDATTHLVFFEYYIVSTEKEGKVPKYCRGIDDTGDDRVKNKQRKQNTYSLPGLSWQQANN